MPVRAGQRHTRISEQQAARSARSEHSLLRFRVVVIDGNFQAPDTRRVSASGPQVCSPRPQRDYPAYRVPLP